MVNEYSRNYTEVLEILKYIPIDEYNKIPKQKIEFYEKYKDRSCLLYTSPSPRDCS